MNYYYPYYSFIPYQAARPGLFGLLTRSFRGFNLSSLINGTQRTLGLVNQAIPVIKQMSPVVKNAKTMFRVMNEFKKADTPVKTVSKEVSNEINEGPTFFA